MQLAHRIDKAGCKGKMQGVHYFIMHSVLFIMRIVLPRSL